jgi:sugar phosphate isomerase/epimerase
MNRPPSIRVGNQSAFSAPLLVPFEFALARGFDCFEFFPDRRGDPPPAGNSLDADMPAELRRSVRQRARDLGVTLSVHAPLHADPLRPEAGKALDDSLRLAADLGARVLNIHLTDPRRVDPYAAAVRPFIDRCAAAGVQLAIENIPATGPHDFNRLFAQLPRCRGPHPAVGMTLDVGHANLHDGSRNDYIKFVDLLNPEVPIVHLHLHENWGDRDSHLVLFTGPAGRDPAGILALFERLRQRGFAGHVVLEQWPDPPELLVEARAKLLQLLTEEGK